MNTTTNPSLWNPENLKSGECRYWEIGPLALWIMRTEKEWQASFEYADTEEDRLTVGEPCEKPTDREWERWAINDDYTTMRLIPVLPDRPIIVRPDSKLHVLPKETVQFFIGIPFWVRLGADDDRWLRDIPTRILSNSWFGDQTQGELCYMSVTSARRSFSDVQQKPFRAYSSVEVRNDHNETLTIERICLRVPYLNLYQGGRYIWTNEQRIVYRGPNELSKLVLGRSGPNTDNAQQLVSKARETLARGLFAPSLGTLTPLQF